MNHSPGPASHRRLSRFCRVLATSAVVLMLFGLVSTTDSSASSASSSRPSFPWKGHSPPCAVRLPIYGSIRYEPFTTCPPKHVLIIGDSVALTMGVQLSLNEENWGTLVENAGIEDCGFVTGYSVEELGNVTALNPKCAQELLVWVQDAHRFKPQAIVVEMGWDDSFQHLINGTTAALGQPGYDAMVEHEILALVSSLRTASSAPIYLLSVPWMDPGTLPNGQPEPAASAASYDEINALLKGAAQTSKSVHFVNISTYLTPHEHYEATVDGGTCRASDGVELYGSSQGSLRYVQTPCGKSLQKGLLSTIREALAKKLHG